MQRDGCVCVCVCESVCVSACLCVKASAPWFQFGEGAATGFQIKATSWTRGRHKKKTMGARSRRELMKMSESTKDFFS